MADQHHQAWWRSAAIYQVYLRSFADGNGDGVGDLAGLRSRLPYLADLGVDAVWIVPWYPSPMADGGYDVADFRAIDPVFGTLAEAEKLIEEAHDAGIRVICDIVPNHCSDRHAWFQRALAAGPGAPERECFWFRKGRGENGELPPTDLQSIFGGPAWTRVPDGEWYLHLFASEQPDFNWNHPAVREEFEDILRFWLDRGVDGIRIDSAAVLIKDPLVDDRYEDNDGIHEVYQAWRRIADTYPQPRALIGEVWLPDHEAFARYLRPDELHTAFNFAFLGSPWDADALRECIDMTLEVHAPVAAPATWVLSNHDVTRQVTRFGRVATNFAFADKRRDVPSDLVLGARRARAADTADPRAARRRLPLPGRGTGPAKRSRTSPTNCAKTPCSTAPGVPTPAVTAAECRCPGQGRCRRSASAPTAHRSSHGCRSRRTGPPGRSPCSRATRRRSCSCTVRRCGSGGPSLPSVTARCGGWTRLPASSRSPATSISPASPTCPATR